MFSFLKKTFVLFIFEFKQLLTQGKYFLSIITLFLAALFMLKNIDALTTPAKPKVAVCIEDSNPILNTLIRSVLNDKLSDSMEVLIIPLDEAKSKIASNEVLAALLIPDGIFNDLNSLTPATISLYTSNHSEIKISILEKYILQMCDFVSEGEYRAISLIKILEANDSNLTRDQSFTILTDMQYTYIQHFLERMEIIDSNHLNDSYLVNSFLSYYTSSLLIGVMLFTGFALSNSFYQDIISNRFSRLKSVGYTTFNIYLSKLIYMTLLIFSFSKLSLYLITTFVFKSQINMHISSFIPWIFFSFFIATMFLALSTLALKQAQRQIVCYLWITVITLISGLIIPLIYLGVDISFLSAFNPILMFHNHILQGSNVNIVVFIIYILAFISIAIIKLRRFSNVFIYKS